ncbi:metalloregulator ArsR/SmtB family transcription factor [bacterium]|nr:metalloregulator ArsR/SmtB family transcription factor [bacterium]
MALTAVTLRRCRQQERVRLPNSIRAADQPVSSDSFQSVECAEQLKALSDPLRLRIIDALRYGEMTVSDIALTLEVEIVIVSHHLGILKNAHLVERKRDGRYMIYRLREDLLQKARGKGKQFLNLGCCRLEVPEETEQA